MTTPHILFEQLENSGCISGDVPNIERIQRMTLTELIDLGEESALLTATDVVPHDSGSFAHSASLALGGGRSICYELVCRRKRVQQLAQFAALYSDRVYVHNFLSAFAVHPKSETDVDLESAQRALLDDLEVLLQLRPLIEAGRVVPVTAPETWCPHCFGIKLNAIDDFDPRLFEALTDAGEYLRSRFLREARVTLERIGNYYSIDVRAPEDLLEHGFQAHTFEGMPEILQKAPELRALIMRGKSRSVPLTRRQLEKLEIHKAEAADVLENILFELAISQSFRTSLLTERPIDVKILQSLTSDSHQEQRNALIRKHLTTMVPFLEDISSSDLLRLREEEADSFLLFRQALNRTIDAATDRNTDFTDRQAQELYGDELEPSLARLDLKLRSAQSTLAKRARRKATALVGAISFGLFTGFVPASLEAAAKVLGFTKVAADLAESVLNAGVDQEVIMNEDMYFLWKVREVSRR